MATSDKRSTLTKHSLVVAGHRTSISLEGVFWVALRRLAEERQTSVAALVAEIDAERGAANLSSAIRVYLFSAIGRPPTQQRQSEQHHVS